MEFSEKLIRLRREAGLSQEQLADEMGVTRQSVSKWESGTAMPELSKLIALSERFDVSVDYLVKDDLETPEQRKPQNEEVILLEQKLDRLAEDYRESWGPYFTYTSKVKLFGLPLVSIRFGRERHPSKRTVAVGIIAIGNFSVGLISIGMLSAGIISLGMVTVGLLALGMVSIGYLAVGISVLGVYGAGVAVNAAKLAIGIAAKGGNVVSINLAGRIF